VDAAVLRVRTEEHVGVQGVNEYEYVVPVGRPVGAANVTACAVPELRVAITVVWLDWPWVTVRDVGLTEREKSKAGLPKTLISAADAHILLLISESPTSSTYLAYLAANVTSFRVMSEAQIPLAARLQVALSALV
jgi:hypothetical protein